MKLPKGAIRLVMYGHQSTPLAGIDNDDNGYYFPTTYIEQEHANMCSDASQAMVNHFFGESIPSMLKNPRSFLGSSDEDDLPKAKFNKIENLSLDNIGLALKLSGPLLMDMPTKIGGHMVTCIGCTEKDLIYHDPLDSGNLAISKAEYERINGGSRQVDAFLKNRGAEAIYRGDSDLTVDKIKQEGDHFDKPTYIIHKTGVIYADSHGIESIHQFTPDQNSKSFAMAIGFPPNPTPFVKHSLEPTNFINLGALTPNWEGPFKGQQKRIATNEKGRNMSYDIFKPEKMVARHFSLSKDRENLCERVRDFLTEYSKLLKGQERENLMQFVKDNKKEMNITELMKKLDTHNEMHKHNKLDVHINDIRKFTAT